MKDALILEHKTYISAKRAAEITGYTSDYVGQLCRSGKIESKIVGRGWFVLEESLLKHKLINDEVKTNKKTAWKRRKFQKSQDYQIAKQNQINTELETLEKNVISVPLLLSAPSANVSVSVAVVAKEIAEVIEKNNADLKNISPVFAYESVASPLIPLLKKKISIDAAKNQAREFTKEFSREMKARFVPAHFSMRGINFASEGIAFASAGGISPQRNSTRNSPGIFGNIQGDYSMHFAAAVFLLVVIAGGGFFIQSVLRASAPRNSGTAQVASVGSAASSIIESTVHGFQAVTEKIATTFGFGSKQPLAVAPQNSVSSAPEVTNQDLGFRGIAITPSTGSATKDELVKQQIRDSFSDEVVVHPDQSGTAGVITPVFKKASEGNFVYVLVPVNGSTQ